MRVRPATLLYFSIVFGSGFVLGMVRVPFLVPRVRARTAEMIEAPFMLLAIVIGARWVDRRLPRSIAPAARWVIGLSAAALVLVADLCVGVGLRNMPPAQVFTQRDPVSGVVYYALHTAFAVMPALLARRATNGPQHSRTNPR